MESFDPAQILELMEKQVPFNRLLGIKGEEAGEGRCVLSLPIKPEFVGDPRRPALHGGVISALLDTAGGIAAWSSLKHGESVSTVDLRVDFLEPGRVKGTLRAEAQMLRKGNRVCHVRMTATQEGQRIAEGLGVYNIHRRAG